MRGSGIVYEMYMKRLGMEGGLWPACNGFRPVVRQEHGKRVATGLKSPPFLALEMFCLMRYELGHVPSLAYYVYAGTEVVGCSANAHTVYIVNFIRAGVIYSCGIIPDNLGYS